MDRMMVKKIMNPERVQPGGKKTGAIYKRTPNGVQRQ